MDHTAKEQQEQLLLEMSKAMLSAYCRAYAFGDIPWDKLGEWAKIAHKAQAGAALKVVKQHYRLTPKVQPQCLA